ncbi:MAG: methionine--tRNA ligase, partial [Pseudorhodoplanes sp.]|nr:methionine--tRNA ligase [Pseudorhodoplanes sp.]
MSRPIGLWARRSGFSKKAAMTKKVKRKKKKASGARRRGKARAAGASVGKRGVAKTGRNTGRKTAGKKAARRKARAKTKEAPTAAKAKRAAKATARGSKQAAAHGSAAKRPVPRTPYFITTAISYPNGAPHIGHAYEAIATDAIARFQRLDGYDVFFLTGTDEHGQKIQQTAVKEGLSARELVDRNSQRFRDMVARMNCSNDDFIRTTEDRHHRSSMAIWARMKANGDIYLSKYAGWYSVRDEAYYAESETHLDEQKARIASRTGTPVEWVEEESYFFRLSAYQDKLLDLYTRHPDFVLPKERLNEVASFVRGGLQDLSISRTTFDWGIKVPDDPKHIMYVWVDALTNYITG